MVPSNLNPNLSSNRPAATDLSVDEIIGGVRSGDRVVLSRAITLIESTKDADRSRAQEVIQACLADAGDSIRVGVTGVPGVGKSSFIETLGLQLADDGHRIAVLAIDPSSERTRGSILGDKTRMGGLSQHENVYIRPSPTGGSLGGVARKTRETILLCEAAGYDTIFVETVGVGQSEITVHSMVDVFLLLGIAGAGDELQGIKRGVVEMADLIAINKADGDNVKAANRAKRQYENALHLFPPTESGWTPPVLTCSAETGAGVGDVWDAVTTYRDETQASGFFAKQRRRQARFWMRQTIEQRLKDDFFSDPSVQQRLDATEREVLDGTLSSFAGADRLLNAYRSAHGSD
jgi:LAO/AO transport system kinase